MTSDMLAARLHGVGDLRVAEPEPVPVPGAGRALVRVTAVGICGSDLHWYAEGGIGDARLDPPARRRPRGGRRDRRRTRAPGSGSRSTRRCRAGTASSASPGTATSARRSASSGTARRTARCASTSRGPTTCCTRCPTRCQRADVAMLEPLGVAIHAHDLGHQRVGATVVVVGCGPIGLCLRPGRAGRRRRARARGRPAAAPRARPPLRLGADAVLPARAGRVRRGARRGHGRARRATWSFEAAGLGRRGRPGGRRGDARRARRARRHPRRRQHDVHRLHRPAQGADARPGAADEGGLPAGDRARGAGDRRRPGHGEPHVRARRRPRRRSGWRRPASGLKVVVTADGRHVA